MPAATRPASTLYAELVRRGLPEDYARRTAGELDDHRADLLEDLRRAGAGDAEEIANERLGESRQLARRIAADYQRRSWFGRWPLVSFLFLPPVLLVLGWTVLITAIGCLSAFVHWLDGPGMPSEYTTGRNLDSAYAFYYGAVTVFSFAFPGLLAWWYSRFALTGAQSRAYLILASVSFGLMNGLVYHSISIDPDNAERALNGFGLMLAKPTTMLAHYAQPLQLAQLLAPLLVGAALFFRDRSRRRAALAGWVDGATLRAAA